MKLNRKYVESLNHSYMKFNQLKLYLLIFTISLFGCDHEFHFFGAARIPIEQHEYLSILKKYIKENTNHNSTILLGYKLGWSKKQVESHTDSLIGVGILLPKSQYPLIIFNDRINSLDTLDQALSYKYKFQYYGDRIGLLSYELTNDTLSHLDMHITDQENLDSGSIRTDNYIFMLMLLESKYGNPSYTTLLFDEARSKKSFKVFVWLNGTKEIQLMQENNICRINYTNIYIAEKDEENIAQSKIDEIENKIFSDSIDMEIINMRRIE